MQAAAFTEDNVRLIGCYSKVSQILHGEIPIPETVELFLSNTCNFSCPHCLFAQNHNESKHPFMPTDLACSVLREARFSGTGACEFSGGAESMLHPDFLQILEFQTKQNYLKLVQ